MKLKEIPLKEFETIEGRNVEIKRLNKEEGLTQVFLGRFFKLSQTSISLILKKVGITKMNNVILLGRLTREAELRYTPSGKPVCQFTLAVQRNYKIKKVSTMLTLSMLLCGAKTGNY